MRFDPRNPSAAAFGPTTTDTDAGSRTPPAACTRRACLRALAASSLALRTGFAAAAAPASARLWLTLFTGTAGGPVHWLTQGTEFVVVDGVATPVRGRISVIAAMALPRDGGSTRVAYLLQGCTVTPTRFEVVPRLSHPITGEEISTAVAPPLKLGWMLTASGDLTEDLVAANGTRAIYRGTTWESPGIGEGRSATLDMSIRLERPNGDIETFTEISKTRGRPAASLGRSDSHAPSDDFVPAESETFTVRELPDPAKYQGRTATSMSMNHGINYRSADALREALRSAESAALNTFFEQLPGWVQDGKGKG